MQNIFTRNKNMYSYMICLLIALGIIFITNIAYSNSINTNDFDMKFSWPCKPKCEIVKDFDSNLPSKYSAGNRGIDLKVQEGDFIYAPYDGKVFFVGKVNSKNIVSIKHENNIRTTYVGLKTNLSENDLVKKNETIGIVSFENMDPKFLHFGVILNKDTYLDPKIFLYEKIHLLPNVKW